MKKRSIDNLKKLITVIPLGMSVLIFNITGCKSGAYMERYFARLLKDIDKVQIQYFNQGDTLIQIITNQDHINVYKEVISGRQEENLKCDSTGRILYYIQDSLRFEAYFSTSSTGSKYETGVITYFFKPDSYKTRFTYRAGMGIDEDFYNKKAKNDSKETEIKRVSEGDGLVSRKQSDAVCDATKAQ